MEWEQKNANLEGGIESIVVYKSEMPRRDTQPQKKTMKQWFIS